MKQATNLNRYFADSALPGLRAYFAHVREGQNKEYRTPFAAGSSVQSVLNDWSSILESIQDEWPSLWDYESEMREKVGPMSIMKPLRERMNDIEAYYDCVKGKADTIEPAALREVLQEFANSKGMRVRSAEETVKNMKLSTNSGSPYFTKRKYVVDDTIPFGLHMSGGDVIFDTNQKSIYDCCAVLGWRGQEGGPSPTDVKQRVVWMFPFVVNIAELQAYQPLISAFQQKSYVPAWCSMDHVDREITNMFDSKPRDQLVVCTDFSKFDQHFNYSLQDAARRIIGGLFSESYMFSWWMEEIYPIKYMIPIMYDVGKLKFGNHGMGSGSGGTNVDETLAHRALQHESAIRIGTSLNTHSQCLGDDGLLTYPGITVDQVVSSYTSHGLEMNPDKQYASTDDCVYLRRWHHTNYRQDGICVGVYSTFRALGRLMEQERWYDNWSREMVALRQLSILENVKYHPKREAFVDFCMKRDRYRLGIDIPGFLTSLGRYAREAIDNMPDFMGYTRSISGDSNAVSGIQSWWIVQYLRSKS